MIDHALAYAAAGWPIIPLGGKLPLTKNGSSDATTDPAIVRAWWDRWPSANIGLATGRAGGMWVVDVDGAPGEATIAALGFALPATLTSYTGGGGRHLIYSYPAGETIKNSQGVLGFNEQLGHDKNHGGSKVDTRGDGGYIVLPPSVHPDTGALYAWADLSVPIAAPSPELLEGIKPRQLVAVGYTPTLPTDETRATKYGRALLDGIHGDIASCAEGGRNQKLFAKARRLGELAAACNIGEAEAIGMLVAAGTAAGLPAAEADKTSRSGWRKGLEKPEGIPDGANAPGDTPPIRILIGGTPTAAQPAGESTPGASSAALPVITLAAGDLPTIMVELESALAAGPVPLFRRAGELVRIVRGEANTVRAIQRPAQAMGMLAVNEPWLVQYAGRCARFRKWDGRTNEYIAKDCSPEVARTFLSRRGSWNLPPLVAIVETPTLRPDGTILERAGYDHETGLFLSLGGVDWPTVPEAPTKQEAWAALQKLRAVIATFPFADPHDESIALAAIITGIIRRSLKSAPMFAFNAPRMASGKTLLAHVVSLVATGRPASMMGVSPKPEEEAKRLLAVLMEGDPMIVIDNIGMPFASDAMCSILTEEHYKDRVLGSTRTVETPTCVTWMATGNNLIFEGDMTTRVLRCDLDAKIERPEERRFDVNLYEHIPAHRAELVIAVLTVLRAFHIANDKPQLKNWARFEEWSGWVRGSLVWLAMPDPVLALADLEESDPVRESLSTVLHALRSLFGRLEFTVKDAIAGEAPGFSGRKDPELPKTLIEVAGRRGEITPGSLAKWFKRYEKRLESGMRLERCGWRDHVVLWRIVTMEGNEPEQEII